MSDFMTHPDLARAAELCEGAAPKPWTVRIDASGFVSVIDANGFQVADFGCGDERSAEFAAESRALIPQLLQHIATQSAVIGELRTALVEALISWEARIDQCDYPDNASARHERKRIAELFSTGDSK